MYDDLKIHYNISYDQKDAVGRRYRRQDAIGTPLCITVDHDSLNDDMVTVRNRDTMKQTRVEIKDLKSEIDKLVNISNYL